jgi:hypothetical protein
MTLAVVGTYTARRVAATQTIVAHQMWRLDNTSFFQNGAPAERMSRTCQV